MSDLPPHVRAEVQRILDGAARRLLEQANRDAAGAGAGINTDLLDDGFDEAALFLKGESVPVKAGDGDGRNMVKA